MEAFSGAMLISGRDAEMQCTFLKTKLGDLSGTGENKAKSSEGVLKGTEIVNNAVCKYIGNAG